jgi:hypothetical protein
MYTQATNLQMQLAPGRHNVQCTATVKQTLAVCARTALHADLAATSACAAAGEPDGGTSWQFASPAGCMSWWCTVMIHAPLVRNMSKTACADHDLPTLSGADIGHGVQPCQLLQAARSAMAEAISCGDRLVAALQQRPAEEVAAALAAAPAARAPAKKKGRTAADDTAQCTESCPIRCIGAWCNSELTVPAGIFDFVLYCTQKHHDHNIVKCGLASLHCLMCSGVLTDRTRLHRVAHAAVLGLAAVLGDAASLAAWRGAEELICAACDYGAATLQLARRIADTQPPGGNDLAPPICPGCL